MDDRDAALARAHEHATTWLASLDTRPVPPQASVADVVARLGSELPDGPTRTRRRGRPPGPRERPTASRRCRRAGSSASSSAARHPAALAADWLVSAWDQNAGLRQVTPAHSAVEDVASAWLLDLLGLPPAAAVGYVTGGTMANFTCLAAARDEVLRRAGWDRRPTGSRAVRGCGCWSARRGTTPSTWCCATSGSASPRRSRPTTRAASTRRRPRGRPAGPRRPDDRRASRPATCTPAPSTRSPRRSGSRTSTARGCTSTAPSGSSPRPRRRCGHLIEGYAAADSWGTDAHKTLNVPYDCGIAIVRDPVALKAAMSMHGDYLIQDAAGDPFEKVPELSRRARALPVWAVLRVARPHRGRRPGRPAGPARPRLRRRASARSRAPRCSTTSSTPSCARPSAATSAPGRSSAGCSPTARPGCPAPSGGQRGAPHLRQQLVDHRRRRRAQPGRAPGGGGRRDSVIRAMPGRGGMGLGSVTSVD